VILPCIATEATAVTNHLNKKTATKSVTKLMEEVARVEKVEREERVVTTEDSVVTTVEREAKEDTTDLSFTISKNVKSSATATVTIKAVAAT